MPTIGNLQGLAGDEVMFYFAAWLIAMVCGGLATFIDRKFGSLWDLAAISAVSGFVAIAVIFLSIRIPGGAAGAEPYYLGIAVAVGLLGKRGLKLVDWMIGSTFQKLGINERIPKIEDSESVDSTGSDGGNGSDSDSLDE